MAELVVNLDELNLGELFDVRHQEASDIIKGAVGLTIPCQIHMDASIGKDKPVISRKTVQDRCESLVAFHITRTFEEFVQHSRHTIL
jgi:plasmid maintenance system antidote protein VapI